MKILSSASRYLSSLYKSNACGNSTRVVPSNVPNLPVLYTSDLASAEIQLTSPNSFNPLRATLVPIIVTSEPVATLILLINPTKSLYLVEFKGAAILYLDDDGRVVPALKKAS